MKIAFVGDFMLSGDQARKQLHQSRCFKAKLESFDLRVATLETAVGNYDEIDSIKMPKSEVAVWSLSEDIHKLEDLNINIVSLANNHACDCGVDAMLRLKEELHSRGITAIGGGINEEEAMQPAVYEKDGKSLAIIACCEDNPDSLGTLCFASDTEKGIYRLDERVIVSQIKQLKQLYDYVAIVVHWGVEHMWLPEHYDVAIGKKMIDAGADVIIGGHPHHIQPMVTCKGKPIYYSLGNFYFPNFCLDKISNVYYPNDEELKQLPVFDWMAPSRRNFAMRYFWKYYGRLGIIALMDLQNDKVTAHKLFSIYKNGALSLSAISFIHTITLRVFLCFVDKKSSDKINKRIMKTRNLIKYSVLSRFLKKYRFFQYLSSHNY